MDLKSRLLCFLFISVFCRCNGQTSISTAVPEDDVHATITNGAHNMSTVLLTIPESVPSDSTSLTLLSSTFPRASSVVYSQYTGSASLTEELIERSRFSAGGIVTDESIRFGLSVSAVDNFISISTVSGLLQSVSALTDLNTQSSTVVSTTSASNVVSTITEAGLPAGVQPTPYIGNVPSVSITTAFETQQTGVIIMSVNDTYLSPSSTLALSLQHTLSVLVSAEATDSLESDLRLSKNLVPQTDLAESSPFSPRPAASIPSRVSTYLDKISASQSTFPAASSVNFSDTLIITSASFLPTRTAELHLESSQKETRIDLSTSKVPTVASTDRELISSVLAITGDNSRSVDTSVSTLPTRSDAPIQTRSVSTLQTGSVASRPTSSDASLPTRSIAPLPTRSVSPSTTRWYPPVPTRSVSSSSTVEVSFTTTTQNPVTTTNNLKDCYFKLTFNVDCQLILNNTLILAKFVQSLENTLSANLDIKKTQVKLYDPLCGSVIIHVSLHQVPYPEVKDKLYSLFRQGKFEVPIMINNQLLKLPGDQVKQIDAPNSLIHMLDTPNPGLDNVDIIVIIVACCICGILVTIGIILCGKECYRRKYAQSFDLLEVPHVNLKLEDFTLTRIPRPKTLYNDESVMMQAYVDNNCHRSGKSHVTNGNTVHTNNIQLKMQQNKDGLVVGVTGYTTPINRGDKSHVKRNNNTHPDKSAVSDPATENLITKSDESSAVGACNPIFADDESLPSTNDIKQKD